MLEPRALSIFFIFSLLQYGVLLGIILKVKQGHLVRLLKNLIIIAIVTMFLTGFFLQNFGLTFESQTALLVAGIFSSIAGFSFSYVGMSVFAKSKTFGGINLLFYFFSCVILFVVTAPMANVTEWNTAGMFSFFEGLVGTIIFISMLFFIQWASQSGVRMASVALSEKTAVSKPVAPQKTRAQEKSMALPEHSKGMGSPGYSMLCGLTVAIFIILGLTIPTGVTAQVVIQVENENLASLNCYFNPSFTLTIVQPSFEPGTKTLVAKVVYGGEQLDNQIKEGGGDGTYRFSFDMPERFVKGDNISVFVELYENGVVLNTLSKNFVYGS
jgi:hypothetical protein